MDGALNNVLTKAPVDAWQTKPNPYALPAQQVPENQFDSLGPQVSLTTAVEARFVNTLVTRHGKPDYVPLTTNL